MIIDIPLSKAKNLAEEINQTVEAGTETAKMLNDLIAMADGLNMDYIPIYRKISKESANIAKLFYFFDEVGMLD